MNLFSAGMIKLYIMWAIPFQATIFAGYAIAVLTAINSLPQYQNYFQFTGLGVSTGLVFCLWPVSACATFWLGPILADQFGRRGAMIINSALIMIGTLLFAFAQDIGMILAGRIFLGAGVGMIQTAAPAYVVETAPTMNRGLLTGTFNCFWLIGNGLGTVVVIATESINSPWAWRVPVILQLIPALILILGALLVLPESPRWLFSRNKPDAARAFLIRYHGNGETTEAVEEEAERIQASIKTQAEVGGRWSYRALVRTRANRYRLTLAVMMGAFGQLSGNGLAYFLPSLYAQVGVTSVRSQLVMTLVATCAAFPAAIVGTYHADILGRRRVLILGSFGCMLMLACAMGCSAASGVHVSSGTHTSSTPSGTEGGLANGSTNQGASRGAIAFLILLGAAYAWGYTPMQPIYPSEVLTTAQRATGNGCVVLAANLANVGQQFALPVAIERIGFWTYLPYVVWTLFETSAWYFLAVETRGRSLEELDEVFNSPNPVRASLVKAHRVRSDPLPAGIPFLPSASSQFVDGSTAAESSSPTSSVKDETDEIAKINDEA